MLTRFLDSTHHYIKYGTLDDKSHQTPLWDDLVVQLDDALVPLIDREEVSDCDLTEKQKQFREDGVLILPGLIDDSLIKKYCQVREPLPLGGYQSSTPYMFVNEIKDIALDKRLSSVMEELIGEPMGVHLNLTGWVSTERDWHQDEYLNPPCVNGWYISVWIALDDISPDSGPFEYVPGSHKWDLVRRNKVLEFLKPKERISNAWPKFSERFLTKLFNDKVTEKGLETKQFIAKKGDVLFWHSRLMHRGTKPNNPSLLRKSLICHYSGINHRPDMPIKKQYKDQGYYFVLSNNSLGRLARNVWHMLKR